MAKGMQVQDVLVMLAIALLVLLVGVVIIGYLQSGQGQLSEDKQFSELCPEWVSKKCSESSMQEIKSKTTERTLSELCGKLEGSVERCKNRCLGCPKETASGQQVGSGAATPTSTGTTGTTNCKQKLGESCTQYSDDPFKCCEEGRCQTAGIVRQDQKGNEEIQYECKK